VSTIQSDGADVPVGPDPGRTTATSRIGQPLRYNVGTREDNVAVNLLFPWLLWGCTDPGPYASEPTEPVGDSTPPFAGPTGDTAPPTTTDPAPTDPLPAMACTLTEAELQAAFDAWRDHVVDELDRYGVPGASIAVGCGSRLLAEGIGVRGDGSGEAVGTETRFQAASVTKNFTAAAALAAAEAGALDLHAPVSDAVPYVNDHAPYTTPITVHDLMTHQAGYPTQFSGFADTEVLASYFAELGDADLWAPAGAVFVYSNLGAALAGLAVEEAMQEPFADVVGSEVFTPAQMTRATLDAEVADADADHATGHSGALRTTPTWGYFPTGYYGPMGGAWLTASDLVRWGQVQLEADGSVLDDASLEAMRTPWATTRQVPGQAHGYHLFLDDWGGTEVWQHAGGAPGFQAVFAMVPSHGLVVAAMVNSDALYAPWLTDEAIRLATGAEPDDPAATILPVDQWARYAGAFHDPHGLGDVAITYTGTSLSADVTGLDCAGPLVPFALDNFVLSCPDGLVLPLTFWVDDTGTTTEYVTSVYGIAAPTGSSPPPSPL